MREVNISFLAKRIDAYHESDEWKDAQPTLQNRLQKDSPKYIYDECQQQLSTNVIGQMWLRYYMTPEVAGKKILERKPTEWDYEDFCYYICVAQEAETLMQSGKGKLVKSKVEVNRKAKVARQRATDSTYHYLYYDTHPERITALHLGLVNAKMIAKYTRHEDLEEIFSGKDSTVRIKWIASQAWLKYLLLEMKKRGYITTDEGSSIWITASNHFIDRKGRMFTNVSFDKVKMPKTFLKPLDTLIELLNIQVPLPVINKPEKKEHYTSYYDNYELHHPLKRNNRNNDNGYNYDADDSYGDDYSDGDDYSYRDDGSYGNSEAAWDSLEND